MAVIQHNSLGGLDMIQTKTIYTVHSPGTIVYGRDSFEEVGDYAKKIGD